MIWKSIVVGTVIGLSGAVLVSERNHEASTSTGNKEATQPIGQEISQRSANLQKRAAEIVEANLLTRRNQFELEQTVQQWFADDPVACFEWLHERELLGMLNDKFVVDTLFEQQKGDLRLVGAILLRLPYCGLRERCIENALFAGAGNADAVLDLLPHVTGRTCEVLLSEVVVKFDNEKAVQAIIQHRRTLGKEFGSLLQRSLVAWGKRDPKAAASFLLGLTPSKGGGAPKEHLTMFLQGLSEENPRGLTGIADMLPKDERTKNYLNAALCNLARSDVTAAWKWAQSVDSEIDQFQAMSRVAWAFSDVDPEKAVQMADSVPGFAPREEVYTRAAGAMFDRNKVKSATWAEKIADPLLQAAASRVVATQWLETDPSGFAKFALVDGPEGNSDLWRGFLAAHLRQLSKSHPNASAPELPDWAGRLSPEIRRTLQGYITAP